MTKDIVELIFPRRCAICGKVVTPKGEFVHFSCRQKLVFIHEPRCLKCGKPLEKQEQEYCYDCSMKTFHYKRGFALLKYDGYMRRSISQFKYHGKKEYADFYVSELLKRYENEIRRIQPDVLVPVPIHSSKRAVRGFNQAELIAHGVGRALGIPCVDHFLIRNRKTLPQKQLNDKERLKNLEQAFLINTKIDRRDIHTVILVDDIYTTGSTIEACTKILMKAGVKDVYFISVCIGQGY